MFNKFLGCSYVKVLCYFLVINFIFPTPNFSQEKKIKGKVIGITPSKSWIDIGKRENITEKTSLQIKRKGKVIGTAIVINVMLTTSEIKITSIAEGIEIDLGDIVESIIPPVPDEKQIENIIKETPEITEIPKTPEIKLPDKIEEIKEILPVVEKPTTEKKEIVILKKKPKKKITLYLIGITLGIVALALSSGKDKEGEKVKTGKVDVSSFPSDAKVFLGDVEKGVTPLSISNVPAGKYTLKLTKSDYSDLMTEVVVNPNQTTLVWEQLIEKPVGVVPNDAPFKK